MSDLTVLIRPNANYPYLPSANSSRFSFGWRSSSQLNFTSPSSSSSSPSSSSNTASGIPKKTRGRKEDEGPRIMPMVTLSGPEEEADHIQTTATTVSTSGEAQEGLVSVKNGKQSADTVVLSPATTESAPRRHRPQRSISHDDSLLSPLRTIRPRRTPSISRRQTLPPSQFQHYQEQQHRHSQHYHNQNQPDIFSPAPLRITTTPSSAIDDEQITLLLMPRPASAPPTQTSFDVDREREEARFNSYGNPEEMLGFEFNRAPKLRRAATTSFGGYTKGGELIKPPPPLLRPTTFWRRTHRSGVTAASYSPSSHLIRRSTFVAAGLASSHDRPRHDLSAFGVESRVGRVVLKPEWQLV